MNNELKTMNHSFPVEMYDRAKKAKELANDFAIKIRDSKDPGLINPEDFSSLESYISMEEMDVRIVIGLGKFKWDKGHWSFDAPSTRAVMQRMTNLANPKRKGSIANDYLEIHAKYDELSTETRSGFHHHTVMHNIYIGSYLIDEDDSDEIE